MDCTSVSRPEQPATPTLTLPAAESGHGPISEWTLDSIFPSPENEKLYRPVNPQDPEVWALAESILEIGVKEPLVITQDGWILSGHRRYMAARLARLESVPCREEPFRKADDPDRFMLLLREYNRQRVKSFDEKLREEIVSANPDECYESLIEHRQAQLQSIGDTITIRAEKKRAAISPAKKPFLSAIQKVIKSRREFWPLSDRQIHYALLNKPPLIHASKPGSRYDNTPQSYKRLVDLLTRARLDGSIPMSAIADPTRPVSVWKCHEDIQSFIREELAGFLKGYWRDLMQSQPDHIEIVGEKNTVESIIRPVAARFCIPMTIGRGYCSLPPRNAIANRFQESGKDRLVLLILSDFDPDGEEIAHSLARSLRDDFDIENIEAVKVALTPDQVADHHLPPMMKAKTGSRNYGRFKKSHGEDVFELEALEPEVLQELLTTAIDSVIDTDAFNQELDQEKRDATFLEGVRRMVQDVLSELDLGADA
jgi:hypothetical protein